MAKVWFTSDQHYGHLNALTGWSNEQAARPWNSLEEMTEGLIERHNSRVGRGDLVYNLGDAFWRTFGLEKAINVMKRLNGQHFYVWGNHEEIMKDNKSEELRNRFIWLKDIAKIYPPGPPKHSGIVLCHYAMRTWPNSHRGSYCLYGHSHGRLPEDSSLSFDIGVDANDFYPVSMDEVNKRMQAKIDARIINGSGN